MNSTWNTRRILIIIIIIRFSNNEYDFFGTKGSCQKPHFHLKLWCVQFLFGLPGFLFSQLTLINTSIFYLLWSIPQIHCSIHYGFLSFIKSYKTYQKSSFKLEQSSQLMRISYLKKNQGAWKYNKRKRYTHTIMKTDEWKGGAIRLFELTN